MGGYMIGPMIAVVSGITLFVQKKGDAPTVKVESDEKKES